MTLDVRLMKKMAMKNGASTIKAVCAALLSGDRLAASKIARQRYPFVAAPPQQRKYTEAQALRIFIRDGFVDRYSGKSLVFPGTLRVLSLALPDAFPFHPNWKMTETHPAYWELFPTLDHIVPVARGGADEDANLVSTSMLRNSAKANWTLEELSWSIHPPGDLDQWDGMLSWFLAFEKTADGQKSDNYIARWHRAASAMIREANTASHPTRNPRRVPRR